MLGLKSFISHCMLIGFSLTVSGVVVIGIGSHYLTNQYINCKDYNEQSQLIDNCSKTSGIILLGVGVPISFFTTIIFIMIIFST